MRATHLMIIAAAVALGTAAAPLPVRAADPGKGADLFDNYCSDCHTVKAGAPSRKGPNLFGVVGRPTGAVKDFEYSDANRAAGWVWTADRLDHYLTNPKAAIPGTTMKFKGAADPTERADIVAYLATLHP